MQRDRIIQLHQQQKLSEALPAYQAFLAAHPDDAGMWTNLGVLLRTLRHYPMAIACYQRALALRPPDAGILSNLGNALKDCDRLDEAVDCHRRALALEPTSTTVRFNYAIALREACDFDAARIVLDDLLKEDPTRAVWQWERALVNLQAGHFTQGWIDYEARWRTGELPQLDWGCPRWQGEDLSGKRLLLTTEQGFGDTILAARFIPLLAARYPTGALQLVCKPELQRVLAGLPAQLLDAMPGAGSADYYCPLMSLMGVLGIDDHNVPPPTPLSIPAAAREKFAWLDAHAPGRRKVGIVWSGSLTFKDNAKRAAGLEQFLALAELPHLQCYSFQKGPREEDLKTHAATPLICDLAPQLADFADTAAAVMHMDLIVMTDSSLAHLASSLGKPVLNLLQYKPYWLYGTDSRMNAWYPAMRAVRQQQPGEWSTVFAAAREILSAT